MELPTIKDLLHEQCKFVKYSDGKLWYQIVLPRVAYQIYPVVFDFPVSVDDAGGGDFGTIERPVTLMRWIRKHLEYLKGSIESQDSGMEDGS